MYLFLIGSLIYGFDKIKTFKPERKPAKTTFSVIVPFRNEAENLPNLLASISTLNYPRDLYEVILVDDDSDDGSANLIDEFLLNKITNIRVISNVRTSNSPKKDAITSAIGISKHEWIITTDADCLLPKYWLDNFNMYIQKHDVKCLAAPVTYSYESHFLNRFQLLSMLSLQGATVGGFGINVPFLSNGANFAYKKTVFEALNGFLGNNDIASGDDIFLLEKIQKQYAGFLHYLKCDEAIVLTKAQTSWGALINQHIRWAAKTSRYKNTFGKIVGTIVFLMNTLLVFLFMLTILSLLSPKILLYVTVIKLYIDFLLIYKTASFFNQKHILKHYLLSFVIYPFFSCYVAVLSVFTGYHWKGRRFKK